jgi:DNA helicase II / ATP-dependent DNA helicase PcrA
MTSTSLNPAQAAAVDSDSKSILVAAGPGSGKTTVLVERIARLLGQFVRREELVAITYTNAAATEIQRRIDQIPFGGDGELGFCGTLHSFCLRLIQQHFDIIGYPSASIGVLDEEQSDALLQRCAADLNCRASMTAIRKALANLDSTNVKGLEELTAVRFVNELRRNGLISYDLILNQGLYLIRKGIALPYTHLLVDEYQDSAVIDARIYEEISIENKFFVGDDSQSIFAFRGGDVTNFLYLARDPRTEVICLEENYRSDTAICEATNRLIEHNSNRVRQVTRPVSTDGGTVDVRRFQNHVGEMMAVIEAIHISDGTSAVLVRNRKGQEGTGATVGDWVKALQGAGIEVATRQSRRPSDWATVKTAIGVLNDPENDWLAYSLIKAMRGQIEADNVKTNAAAEGVTINAYRLGTPPGVELTSYGQWLAKIGISDESREIVERAISKLLPGSSGTDLMAMLAADEDYTEEEGSGVVVTTFHGAKGREFDNCFLVAFEQELIPGTAKSMDLEESRRLAYVAMTRAKHALRITYCAERRPLFGGTWKAVPVNPSQFIAEAGL